MPGTFVFKPIEAKLTHDTDLVGNMNPYCSFTIGHYKSRGEVAKQGGKHPQWQDSITVSNFSSSVSMANLEVMDKEYNDVLMMDDDLIGSCSINLEEIESQGSLKKWFPLNFKNRPAGEILMEASFEGDDSSSSNRLQPSGLTAQDKKSPKFIIGKSPRQQKTSLLQKSPVAEKKTEITLTSSTFAPMTDASLKREEKLIKSQPATLIKEEIIDAIERAPAKTYTEQNQVIEAHTFMKEVEAVDIIEETVQIEVMEPRKVIRDIEYTKLVPVTRKYDIVEPRVVMREVDAVEPQVVTRYIKVVENVPVKKTIDVVEMRKVMKDVEVYEPRTFTKKVEVTEMVPVKRIVEVTEPVHVTKEIQFIEPVITTQTVVKEIFEPVIVAEQYTQEVGPATLLGVEEHVEIRGKETVLRTPKDKTL